MSSKSLLFLILFVASNAWAQQKDVLQNLVSLVGSQVSVATAQRRPIALTAEAQKAILQIENMIQTTYRKGHPHDPEPLNFQANHCTAATWALSIIGNGFKHSSRLMLTQSAMARSRSLHYYLVFENILASGDRYIVDPTIRQFFVKILTKKELERVPEIFVGTSAQLQNMFYIVLRKYYLVDTIKKDWVNVYLSAQQKFRY